VLEEIAERYVLQLHDNDTASLSEDESDDESLEVYKFAHPPR
jgi:hypothetical protein